jgi:hypothetical protein
MSLQWLRIVARLQCPLEDIDALELKMQQVSQVCHRGGAGLGQGSVFPAFALYFNSRVAPGSVFGQSPCPRRYNIDARAFG